MCKLLSAFTLASILCFGLCAAWGEDAIDKTEVEPRGEELNKRYNDLMPESRQLLDEFEKKTFVDSDGRKLPYRFFAPKAPAEGKKLPLVIFLHGMGGMGSDNTKQMTDQLPCAAVWALKHNQAKNPCFVIAPQSNGYGGRMAWSVDVVRMVKGLIDKTVAQEPIDPNRIYITGLSMGGFGTWNLIGEYPDFFAAAVPVCGGGNPAKAKAIVEGKTPVWAFHGGKDNVVPAELSRKMVDALKAAGGRPKYTEYPDVGHNSWTGAYSDQEMIDWMFEQKRGE